MDKILDIYIGFDPDNNNDLAYDVCYRSIIRNVSDPNRIKIHKLDKNRMIEEKMYWRNDTGVDKGSNNFTYTKFFVPYLNDFKGYAIFCDSDFIWNSDILELLEVFRSNQDKPINVVKHKCYMDSECLNCVKMDGQLQNWYPRKNWSSLILYNCSHPKCKNLTLNNLNTFKPRFLQRLYWVNDSDLEDTQDIEIGSVSHTYNYLYGNYKDIIDPKVIHLTEGGPWFFVWHQNKIPNDNDTAKKWISYLNNDEKKRLIDYFSNNNCNDSNSSNNSNDNDNQNIKLNKNEMEKIIKLFN